MKELFTGTYSSVAVHLMSYFLAYLVAYVVTRIIEKHWDRWYDRITPAVYVMCFVGIWEVSNILGGKGPALKSVPDLIEAAVAVSLGVLVVVKWKKIAAELKKWGDL